MEEGAAAYPRRLFLLWVMGGYYYLLILPHGEEAYGWQRGQKYHSASGRAMDGRRHTAHTTDTYERLVKWQRFEFSSNREQPPRCFERLRHCDEIDFES